VTATTLTDGPVLLADPRIAAVPLEECGEPLVRLTDVAGVSVGAGTPVPPLGLETDGAEDAYAHVRLGLAQRLERAARRLPAGVRLHVVEGYRLPATQAAYFEAYRAGLMRDDPTLGLEESHVLASRFVAPPAVAAHPSGAAIDVTLVGPSGRPLDLGTPIDATPEESGGACYFDSPRISSAARAARIQLATALRDAGFVNYPTEWWHWSFGDRYWAHQGGHRAARYGAVDRLS
jgi:D-alanyl-D-alanine dipeptidase